MVVPARALTVGLHGFVHEASFFQRRLEGPIDLAGACMNAYYPPCKTPAWRWRLGGKWGLSGSLLCVT